MLNVGTVRCSATQLEAIDCSLKGYTDAFAIALDSVHQAEPVPLFSSFRPGLFNSIKLGGF